MQIEIRTHKNWLPVGDKSLVYGCDENVDLSVVGLDKQVLQVLDLVVGLHHFLVHGAKADLGSIV